MGKPADRRKQQRNHGALQREGGETLCAEFIIVIFHIRSITTNYKMVMLQCFPTSLINKKMFLILISYFHSICAGAELMGAAL